MARVTVEVEEFEGENEDGLAVDSVAAVCSKCDHRTESFGTSDRSVRRCLVLLREECPLGEDNFYATDTD